MNVLIGFSNVKFFKWKMSQEDISMLERDRGGRGTLRNLLFSAVQIARFLTEKSLQCQCLNANYFIFILLDSAFARSTNNLIETICK